MPDRKTAAALPLTGDEDYSGLLIATPIIIVIYVHLTFGQHWNINIARTGQFIVLPGFRFHQPARIFSHRR